jgi:hypothetical protein
MASKYPQTPLSHPIKSGERFCDIRNFSLMVFGWIFTGSYDLWKLFIALPWICFGSCQAKIHG